MAIVYFVLLANSKKKHIKKFLGKFKISKKQTVETYLPSKSKFGVLRWL